MDQSFVETLANSISGYDWFEQRWVSTNPKHFIERDIPDSVSMPDFYAWLEANTTGRFYIITGFDPAALYVPISKIGFEHPKDVMIFTLRYS